MVKIFWTEMAMTTTTAWNNVTFLDQSSNSSCVLSLSLKLSPSAFSFCPSTWLSHPLPSTASTRRMYAFSWRSICLAQMMDPANGGKSRTRLISHALLWGYCTYKANAHTRARLASNTDSEVYWISRIKHTLYTRIQGIPIRIRKKITIHCPHIFNKNR